MQHAACLALAAGTATAATFPEKPIRVVVPSGAGGPAELCLRAVMDVMRADLGQPSREMPHLVRVARRQEDDAHR